MAKPEFGSAEHIENVGIVSIDGEHSINGLLLNPFAGKSKDEMDDMVTRFLKTTQLNSTLEVIFRKGAMLAQNSAAFDDGRVDEMTLLSEEKHALAQEGPGGHKWDQPAILYALVACCSMSAAVQGWDETAVNQGIILTAR